MRRLVLTFVLLAVLPARAGADDRFDLRGARWIWFPEGNAAQDAPVATRYFRCRVELPAAPKAARWLITADDAHVAYVNGTEVARSDHWPSPDRVDVTRHVRAGANVLAVSAFNGAGPGGLIAKLHVVDEGGTVREVVSDKSWRASKTPDANWTSVDFNDAAWSPVMEVGTAGAAPWGVVGPAEPIVPDDDFPRFIVPGHDAAMQSLRNLYWLHYRKNGPMATLWDEWLPPATLWPASGQRLRMRQRWAAALSSRHIDEEGYVSTHQHDGTGHANGWPFPLWHQGAGIGWHFVGTGVSGYEPPLTTPDKWTLRGASAGAVDKLGWHVDLTAPGATLQTPPLAVEVYHAPFLRLNWRASGLEDAKPYVEWTTKDDPPFDAARRVYFAPAASDGEKRVALLGERNTTLAPQSAEVRTMIPLYKHPLWKGTVTGLRIGFEDAPAGAKLIIKSFHTAYDTRHNINNFNFVRGVASYFNWTGDVAFLRGNAGRARTAMRYAMEEFQTRHRKLVFTPWVGHEGTSGVHVDAAGRKTIRVGRGVGNNYWDLMPFGGEDALATIYYYDALRDLADLEQAIAGHPAWNVPSDAPAAFDPADLRQHADEVKAHAGRRFWSEKTGRFVAAVDRDGVAHDYGFTFLNTEAIYHGFATDEQAKSILAWLSGERTIAGDTSAGDDIYHFRFGPRSTTKRNTDYYFWGWSNPEHIPFGYQVQDGGAVLGWSYHDLMARLMTRGPDDAWRRLRAIVEWFDDVQSEGGYRAYYRDPARGTMQGNNTAGGLGLDAEFVESVLVPNVMLYGFLGFEPTPVGFKLNPRLPEGWPSLEIRGIHFHDAILNVAVARDEITITATHAPAEPMTIELPPQFARLSYGTPIKLEKGVPLRSSRKE